MTATTNGALLVALAAVREKVTNLNRLRAERDQLALDVNALTVNEARASAEAELLGQPAPAPSRDSKAKRTRLAHLEAMLPAAEANVASECKRVRNSVVTHLASLHDLFTRALDATRQPLEAAFAAAQSALKEFEHGPKADFTRFAILADNYVNQESPVDIIDRAVEILTQYEPNQKGN